MRKTETKNKELFSFTVYSAYSVYDILSASLSPMVRPAQGQHVTSLSQNTKCNLRMSYNTYVPSRTKTNPIGNSRY